MAWEILLSFLPPFFGVLAAFLIERLWHRHEDDKDRQKFLEDVRKELESCIKLLAGEGNLCPLDMWHSGISSGLLKLLPNETRTSLASVYFKLENHNYEAEKVRDVSILKVAEMGKPQNIVKLEPVLKDGPSVYRTFLEMLHYQLSLRLIDSEKKLCNEIDDLLKQNMWK
jgi:hypothetical protein